MPSQVSLTTVKGGITRLRTKGAALKDSLYDLLNGYVTAAKTVKVRPGTFRRAVLPAETKGLCSFGGSLHTFCHETVAVPAGYVLHVLSHPDGRHADGTVIELVDIHFAEPMMGFLYIAAEFDTGETFHFWLQSGAVWEADKNYKLGDIVAPSVANGFAYLAKRASDPYPAWKAGVVRVVGDRIEPTVYNDFFYEVTDTQGANPVSGGTEPVWATTAGALTYEDSEGGAVDSPTPTTQPDPTTQPAPTTQDRYKVSSGV